MEVKDLLPGFKVDIRVVSHIMRQDSKAAECYISQVFDVEEDGKVLVHMPTHSGKIIVLPQGVRYELVFTTPAGLFKAEGMVSRRAKKENFYLLAMELNTRLERFQRREYFRLDCMMPLLYTGISEEYANLGLLTELHAKMREESFQQMGYNKGMGTILDISGGGIRFITSENISENGYALLQFQIEYMGKKQQVELVAKMVLSTYKIESGKYENRMMFIYSKDSMKQDELVKYIFETERLRRKRD